MTKEKLYSLLSGGPDSTTLAYDIKKNINPNVICLFINFGQTFLDRELLAARRIAQGLDVSLEEVNIAGLRHAMIGLGEDGGPIIFRGVIEGTYGIASAYARHHGAQALYHANIAEDVDDIPGLDRFFSALQKAVNILPGAGDFRIESPYINIRKKDVIIKAKELGVPLELTWSCLRPTEIHCGECRSCRRRKEAFQKAGIADPTKYLK